MSLFHGKNIVTVDVCSSMLSRDSFKQTQVMLVKQKTALGLGSSEYINSYKTYGTDILNRYLRLGKTEFVDYLPSSVVVATTQMNSSAVKSALESIENATVTILNAKYSAYVDDEDWGMFIAQNPYNKYNDNQRVLIDKVYNYTDYKYSLEAHAMKLNNYWYDVENIRRVFNVTQQGSYDSDIGGYTTIIVPRHSSVSLGTFTSDQYQTLKNTYPGASFTVPESASYGRSFEVSISTVQFVLKPIAPVKEITTEVRKTVVPLNSTQATMTTTTTVTTVVKYTKDNSTYIIDTTTSTTTATSTVSINTKDSYTTNTKTETFAKDTADRTFHVCSTPSKVYETTWRGELKSKWYSVLYLVNNKLKIWIYDKDVGTYPNLDSGLNRSFNFEAYPIVALRNDWSDLQRWQDEYAVVEEKIYNESATDSDKRLWLQKPAFHTKKRYDVSSKMLKLFGHDVSSLTEQYKKSESIDKVIHTFFLLGVCADKSLKSDNNKPYNDSPVVSRLLFDTFDYISKSLPLYSNESYKMSITEGPFNLSMEWSQSTTVENKVIGVTNFATHTVSASKTESWSQGSTDSPPDYLGYDRDFKLIMTKQISSTQIQTITVRAHNVGFSSPFNTQINGNHWKDYEGFDDDLVIPLIPAVIAKYSSIDRSKVMGYCVFMQFYAYQKKHVAWYKTSSFINLVGFIVVAVVTICTAGMGSGWAAAGVGSASSAAGASAASVVGGMLMKLAIGVLVSLALKPILAKINNPFLKTLTAVAVQVALMYAGGGFDFKNFGEACLAVLEVAANAGEMFVNAITEAGAKALASEQASFNASTQAQNEEYANAIDALTGDQYLSTEFIANLQNANTTVNTGNDIAVGSTLARPGMLFYATLEAHRDKDALFANRAITERDFTTTLTIGD